MSLAPQRPNYVLIWIGIVMLTFSMAGNWILDSAAQSSSNLAGPARFSMDYEDSAFLPETSAQQQSVLSAEALAAEDAFDQMIPLRVDEQPIDGMLLANRDGIFGPEILQPFPMESISMAEDLSEESGQGAIVLGIAPMEPVSNQPEQQLHAFKQDRGLSRKQKASERFKNDGQYDSRWEGNNNFSQAGKSGKRRNGRSIPVKSTFTPKGQGRIAVRFFLGRPAVLGSFQNQLASLRGAENERLANLAEKYLEALEEVLNEDHENGHSSEMESENRDSIELQRLAQMKSKLRERLMQRPGGIELIAELSPQQLEALLQKLSAQNPKFRALMSS